MEAYSIIIGLIFIALFFIPIWLFQRSQNKESRNLKKSFHKAVSANGLSVSDFDLWNNIYGIGLDPKNNKLLYLKHGQQEDYTKVIDLGDIAKCSIERKTGKLPANKGASPVTEKLALVLTHSDDKNSVDLLEFYHESVSPQMNGESAVIDKWQKMLSIKLGKKYNDTLEPGNNIFTSELDRWEAGIMLSIFLIYSGFMVASEYPG